MEILNDTTIMVQTPGELSSALSEDNSYTLIYLGADITLTGRITVNSLKQNVIIDGFYPPDETGQTFTLSDQGTDLGQIYVAQPSAVDITFRNMKIAGRNFYGILRAQNLAGTENVIVTFRNISYTGPQLVWHVRGITRIFDSEIIIQGANSSAQEVGEVNRLEIGGKVTVQHNSTTSAVFYLYDSNASFTLLDDARLDVVSTHTFLHRQDEIPFTIGKRAQLNLTTQRSFSYDTAQQISDMLIDEDAVFRYYRLTNDGAARAIYIDGTLTVNRGATVYMQADYTEVGALVRFSSSSARLQLNNPKSFVLYKGGTGSTTRAMSFSSAIPFEINTGQINFWENATLFPQAGTLADIAPDRWHRPGWSSFKVAGTTSGSTTTVTDKTISDEDLALLPTPLSNMKLYNARVFSVGDLPLSLLPVVDDGRPVVGTTEPGASFAAVQQSGGSSYSYTGTADDTGGFEISLDPPIVIGDTVTVSSNTPFLITTITETGVGPGELKLNHVPEQISYETAAVAVSPAVLLKRRPMPSGEDDPVIVNDTRADRTSWEIWARITGPVKTADGKYVLNDAVVFETDDGTLKTLTEEFTMVCQRECAPYPTQDTPLTWPPEKGLLARVSDTLWAREEYSTTVEWQVRPVGTPDDV